MARPFRNRNNFERFRFVRYAQKILAPIFLGAHILSVFTILLEEIIMDLDAGKEIVVGGFGHFWLHQVADRAHVFRGERLISAGKRALRFSLDKKYRNYLVDNLDLEKTYPDHYTTGDEQKTTETHLTQK